MAGFWESVVPGALTAGAGVALAGNISNIGEDAADQMMDLGGQVAGDMAFTPYSVRTGIANTTVGPEGSVDLGVGGGGFGLPDYERGMAGFDAAQQGLDAQAGFARDASMQMIDRSLQSPEQRQMTLFEQLQAAQAPALSRARSAMEARSHAQGRGGIQGNQFGGSGEQFAQSRAEAEARNNALVQSQQLAMQEQAQQGDLGYKYGTLGNQAAQAGAGLAGQRAGLGLQGYESSFLPMQMQLAALREGTNQANLAQTGQISGQNMLAQLGLGGIQTNVNAQKAAAELYGNMFGALAGPAATIGREIDDGGVGGLWDSIASIFS